jgi:hypothetical protein
MASSLQRSAVSFSLAIWSVRGVAEKQRCRSTREREKSRGAALWSRLVAANLVHGSEDRNGPGRGLISLD